MVIDLTISQNDMVTKLPENWNVKHFEDVAEIDKLSLGTTTPPDYAFEYISLSDVDSEEFFIEKSKQVFATAPSRARRIAKKGDVLMSTVRPNLLGFTLIKDDVKDLIASTGFAVISARHCSEEYIFQYLFCQHMAKQFHQFLTGSNYPALSSSDVRRLKIFLPPVEEQRAIARVLGTMDELISKTNRLIEQKKLKKKYLMQTLLTGKKRLPGFSDKWKAVHIYEVAREATRKNVDKKPLTVLSCTKHDGLVPSLEYFGRQIFSQDTSTYKIVPKGHFAYATNHIEEGSIGLQWRFEEALISPMYTVFRTDNSIDDRFFFGLLKSHYCIHQFRARMEGTIDRRGGLRWSAFSVIKVEIPDFEEQKAIANILDIATCEITMLEAKSELLKMQKKWLMQQLLTGMKRLKLTETESED